MSVELLCVGHAAYDTNMFLAEFPRENSKAEIDEMMESGGGPAANAAYLASFWGVRSAFGGLIGEDSYGRIIREEFEAVGTDVTLLELRPGHLTPFSVILVNTQNGSRTIVNRKASSAPFRLPAAILDSMKPKCLLFDGHELEASLQALELYPDTPSILDAGSVREGTLNLAGRVDYLIASERFAIQITGEKNLDDEQSQKRVLSSLRSRFPGSMVVTLGERGLIADENGRFRHLSAFPARVVDTTGAGDIFHGAFAHGLVTGLPFLDNLRRASMAAALSIQTRGGRKSIPLLQQVEEALSNAH